jgi:hypothetical protein
MKHADGYRQCGRSNSIAGLIWLIPSAFGRYPNLLMLSAGPTIVPRLSTAHGLHSCSFMPDSDCLVSMGRQSAARVGRARRR